MVNKHKLKTISTPHLQSSAKTIDVNISYKDVIHWADGQSANNSEKYF